MHIKTLAEEHGARCLVIDPVSTWSKAGHDLSAHTVAERLIDWSKANGTTLVCTSLLDEMSSQTEGGSPLQISTLADTWIARRIVGTLSQTQPVVQALGLETLAA